MKKSITERFWSKVEIGEPDQCWEWTACLNDDGYGQFAIGGGKWTRSHRIAYELVFGDIEQGKEVCHTCDNRKCCNPDHLWIGTHHENMKDMTSKRRFFSKLSETDVLEIKKMRSCGFTLTQLSQKFGVGFQHISRIVNGVCWKTQEDRKFV